MKSMNSLMTLTAALGFIGLGGCASTPPFNDIAGASGELPQHCPPVDCGLDADLVTATGEVVDPETGRKFYIDYPAGLRAGEDVTVVLSLHGGGSYGNWQRNYFPLMDVKDKYRLVIATPNSPVQVWRTEDDEHLHNVVDLLYTELGASNIKAFWLAGHSQGGMTSRRIVCSEYFRDKVDGFLSLSGGRVGGNAAVSGEFFPRTRNENGEIVTQSFTLPANAGGGGAGGLPALGPEPDCDFSHIFTVGEHETTGLPETSARAEQYHCDARVRMPDVVDAVPGYVFDPTRQNPGSIGWGRLPRGGTAQVYVYPNCDGGRVVADVMRMDKGHTEGLEPNVVDQLVRLMVSAQ
jgi:hypothetical protein